MEEPIEVRYTFVMLLAICDPTGHVIGTNVAIARRINMPVPDFERCLKVLMEPDEHSNSREEDGRRVIPSDGERGVKVVNYLTYRDMKDEEQKREYMREYMRKRRELQRSKAPVKRCKTLLKNVTHAEAEAEADTFPAPRGDHSEFIDLWTAEYPKHHGGEAYAFQGGKDGTAVKALLATSGKTPAQLLQMAVAAWKNPAGFNAKMAASICGFNSRFNDIRNELNALKASPAKQPVKVLI